MRDELQVPCSVSGACGCCAVRAEPLTVGDSAYNQHHHVACCRPTFKQLLRLNRHSFVFCCHVYRLGTSLYSKQRADGSRRFNSNHLNSVLVAASAAAAAAASPPSSANTT